MSKKLATCLTGVVAALILTVQPFGFVGIANEDIDRICPFKFCHGYD